MFKARYILSAIALPLTVILYQNIEALAQAKGWDLLLLRAVPHLGEWTTHPLSFAISSAIVGCAVGAWINHFSAKMPSGRETTLVNLAYEVQLLHKSVQRILHSMPKPPNFRVRPGAPTSLPLEEAMRAKAIMASLRSFGVPTPNLDREIDVRATQLLAEYLTTVYPFALRSQKKELVREAGRFLAKIEDRSRQSSLGSEAGKQH